MRLLTFLLFPLASLILSARCYEAPYVEDPSIEEPSFEAPSSELPYEPFDEVPLHGNTPLPITVRRGGIVPIPHWFKMPKGPCHLPPDRQQPPSNHDDFDLVDYDTGLRRKIMNKHLLYKIFTAEYLSNRNGDSYCPITRCISSWKFWHKQRIPKLYACCRSGIGHVYCRDERMMYHYERLVWEAERTHKKPKKYPWPKHYSPDDE